SRVIGAGRESELEVREGGPPGVEGRAVVDVVVHIDGFAGLRTGGHARRRERELEEHRVAYELLEVDLVTEQRVRVTVDPMRLEELAHRDAEVVGDVAETHAAL